MVTPLACSRREVNGSARPNATMLTGYLSANQACHVVFCATTSLQRERIVMRAGNAGHRCFAKLQNFESREFVCVTWGSSQYRYQLLSGPSGCGIHLLPMHSTTTYNPPTSRGCSRSSKGTEPAHQHPSSPCQRPSQPQRRCLGHPSHLLPSGRSPTPAAAAADVACPSSHSPRRLVPRCSDPRATA